LALRTFALLCNHYHHQYAELFHFAKLKLSPLSNNSPFLHLLSPWHILLSVFMNLTPLGTHISGIIQHLFFYDWLISLAQCPQESPILQHGSEFPTLWRLNNSPLFKYGETIFTYSFVINEHEFLPPIGCHKWCCYEHGCIRN
jgi:hypothetical protein